MAGAWKVLVLVLCLAGVSCAHRRHRLRYEDLVAKALRVYNEGQQGRPLFRLVETIPPPQLNSTTRFPLNFRIRETVCTSTPERLRQPQNCAFLEGGEERLCNGQFSRLGRRLSLTVSCDRDCGDLIRGQRVRPSAEPAEPSEAGEVAQVAEVAEPAGGAEVAEPAAAAEAEVPPAAKYLYEKAKYDIISNILRNF
ncbi:15 kDa protein B-like [Heterocephalus glaber]|uniref:15 kDa protein B-like n=1 Tax=Heterocephalus glaber TaxID=10181 RepID=A0AAX6NR33_HETGA|nr:15 kDa protein B-like [Heterocephalus glaber]